MRFRLPTWVSRSWEEWAIRLRPTCSATGATRVCGKSGRSPTRWRATSSPKAWACPGPSERSPGEQSMMQALWLEKADGPESVAVREVPVPEPKAGEVRVAVKAASLNHRELWIPRGQYPGMALPTILGCDCAGTVDELGAGVSGLNRGDEVVLYPGLNWGPSRRTPGRDFGLLGMPGPGTIGVYVCV